MLRAIPLLKVLRESWRQYSMKTWDGEKETDKKRGEEKQNLGIFKHVGDVNIMPILCWQCGVKCRCIIPAHETENKSGISVFICGLQTSLMSVIWNKNTKCWPESPLRPGFISYLSILILLNCKEEQNRSLESLNMACLQQLIQRLNSAMTQQWEEMWVHVKAFNTRHFLAGSLVTVYPEGYSVCLFAPFPVIHPIITVMERTFR